MPSLTTSSVTSRARRQDVEHRFRRPAQAHTQRRDDDGPIDQDRVREHLIEHLPVGPAILAEAELRIGRALLSQELARPYSHASDERLERPAIGGSLQILYDLRLDS